MTCQDEVPSICDEFLSPMSPMSQQETCGEILAEATENWPSCIFAENLVTETTERVCTLMPKTSVDDKDKTSVTPSSHDTHSIVLAAFGLCSFLGSCNRWAHCPKRSVTVAQLDALNCGFAFNLSGRIAFKCLALSTIDAW